MGTRSPPIHLISQNLPPTASVPKFNSVVALCLSSQAISVCVINKLVSSSSVQSGLAVMCLTIPTTLGLFPSGMNGKQFKHSRTEMGQRKACVGNTRGVRAFSARNIPPPPHRPRIPRDMGKFTLRAVPLASYSTTCWGVVQNDLLRMARSNHQMVTRPLTSA